MKHAWALAFLWMGFYTQLWAQPSITYQIETSQQCQEIDGFSASDAWTGPIVGLWKPKTVNQVADWLFSMEKDANGQPKGIGLSIWRFNLGAGSTEQGEKSGIFPNWKRTECFLRADGTYDWNKQLGQRNLMKLAKERGVNRFLAFLNSPPVFYTKNGLATNTGRDGTANLREECTGDLVRFLADVVVALEKRDGIRLDYISPFNEPDGTWNWTGDFQEGSPATNREVARVVRLLSKELLARKLKTKIVVNEASDYRPLFSYEKTDCARGCQIQNFFCPDSTDTYLGDLPNVPRLILGHSYWTNTPLTALRNYRRQLRDSLQHYQVDFWQSETCIMNNDTEIGGGSGAERTMKTALYVARIIHHDLVYAWARSWQWWRAIGRGCLIYETPDYPNGDGKVEDSKLLWTLGHYSRFIRPGAVRLSVAAYDSAGNLLPEGETDPQGLMCSAYRNKKGSYVAVLINYATEGKEIRLARSGRKGQKGKIWKVYRTSDAAGESLKPVEEMKENTPYYILPRSVVTLVLE